VYTRAPSEADDPELRRAYLAALGRHLEIKRELVPLIAAWRTHGIEALLFKGFFLSEFVYPVPGARFHGDVDLLIRAEDGPAAVRIAEELGWRRPPWEPRRFGDAREALLAYLRRPGGAALLDVHRFLAPAARRWTRRQREITDAVWAGSALREWEGTAVRLPTPVDAVVVNLALERATLDRALGFKAHDPVDLHHLMTQGPANVEELRARARELGCGRTLERFLRLCPPSLEPAPARRLPARERLPWMAAGFWEGGYLHVPPLLLRAIRAPGVGLGIARTLPTLLRVRRALRRHQDVREVLSRLTRAAPPAARRSSALTRWRTMRGLHWAVRLLPLGSAGGRCLQQALAAYVALRRQGWNVTFVSGVRRDATGLVGHAWVEEDGVRLTEPLDPGGSPDYRPSVRYPAAS
jgi:hypothetical protein